VLGWGGGLTVGSNHPEPTNNYMVFFYFLH